MNYQRQFCFSGNFFYIFLVFFLFRASFFWKGEHFQRQFFPKRQFQIKLEPGGNFHNNLVSVFIEILRRGSASLFEFRETLFPYWIQKGKRFSLLNLKRETPFVSNWEREALFHFEFKKETLLLWNLGKRFLFLNLERETLSPFEFRKGNALSFEFRMGSTFSFWIQKGKASSWIHKGKRFLLLNLGTRFLTLSSFEFRKENAFSLWI